MDKKVTFYVKFLAESWTNDDWPHTRLWATSRKTRALATTSASGCRACCSWPTETAPWKRRSNRALAAGLQLVGYGLNNCHRVTFPGLTTFYHRQMGAEFHILSYLCSVLRTWAECLSWFHGTKIKNASLFIEILNFRKWINRGVLYSLVRV